jgi:hypothetical protein
MPKQRKNAASKSKATLVSHEKWAPARTLYNVSERYLTSSDVADAAQQLLVTDPQIQVELAERLHSIARRYWEQHREAQRPPAAWYRTQVAQIQGNIEAALAVLRNAKGTALSQLKFRTEQRMGRSLRGSFGAKPPSIEQLLEEFVTTCNSCAYSSPKGAPKRSDIKVTVVSLREVWLEFSSKKKFALNLIVAKNNKDRGGQQAAEQESDLVFIEPGPRFIQVVLQKIDPRVTISAITVALREAHHAARSVQ